jgi:hypothetical protein
MDGIRTGESKLMMTHKERMLRAARGEWPDWLPWVPRIDLWYKSNSMRGKLPAQYRKDASLDEIADDLGGGYHKIIPEFRRSPEDDMDRGLGVFHLWGMPYRPELVGAEREVKVEGDVTSVTYHTPIGSISCKILYTEEMKRAGVTIIWITEHVIKEPKNL